MLFTKYHSYKLKTIFAIIILIFLPVRAHSETAYLTEAKKTDSEVCQFAEFSRAFAKERDKRKLDCKYVLNFNSDISSDETHQQKHQPTHSDVQIPSITILQSALNGKKGTIRGIAKDNVRIAEVLINGDIINVDEDGSFEWSGYVPDTDKVITIEAVDTSTLSLTKLIHLGNKSKKQIASTISAEPQSTSAALDKGLSAYNSGDFATAVREWTSLADQGNASAQFNLGTMYHLGRGVSKDNKEAVRWYKLSAEKGTPVAQFNLGSMYQLGLGIPKDNKEAVRWYRLSAEQGHPGAQANLGFMYRFGRGVLKDNKEAVRWYSLAAEQGDAVAEDILAELSILIDQEKDNEVITSESTSSSKALTASQKEADRLRNELAAIKAQQAETENKITSDTQVPLITITASSSNGPQGTISGRVSDNAGVGEVRVDGQLIQIDNNGNFTANTYVPDGGVSVIVEAVDVAGLSSSMSVRLDRVVTQATAFSFDRLNPIKRKTSSNPDALALIIGVADYKETNATAVYADSDAKVFTDYAVEKLGVPRGRIKTLVNDGADEKDVLLAVKRWLSRGASAGKTDIFVFFAGHGLASDDGKQMYLLPYDGAPELLEKTAILRQELFDDIASANPRSVTVFLDTCYSGTTRGTDMLIASRPIALKALKQSLPDNFTVMTAAAGDQTAKPLEEAKHGMFSYFLMKGMEGDADANQDNQITAGELHAYVQENVVQQSSGSQTPELQGDAERILVQFQ